ncbi:MULTISPECIES: S41 family peptidase [unclassified Sulfuricurvum]|uniref:S41 family peptidase n=1 Tax=unclassified Sulfuricurvum TaxID=2632390 RepID=UPI0002997A62|nr:MULTISPECIES: S41 family peptidase [unclassified Sulfuricurvum]AFV97668.1 hypothetical protein B649_06770 [Candidatus Sulfuricurvum sp. RIFRC-1]HBM36838.1 hypothetical protein [Sulfuricurvum sp.]
MKYIIGLLLLFSISLFASDQNASRPIQKSNSYLLEMTRLIDKYYIEENDSKVITSQINKKMYNWYTTHCDHNKSDTIDNWHLKWNSIEQSCPDMNKNIQNSISNSILKEYDAAIVDITPYKTNQKHGGTGLILRRINGEIIVLGTLEQTSARTLKIPYGTIIKFINGKSTDDMCIEDAWDALKGDIGSKMTIITDKNISYTLTIELPTAPTVSHTIIKDNIVIIKILSFDNDAPKNITKILQQLPPDMNIVLDLRNNTGGLVTSVSGTVSLFVKPFTTLFKNKSRHKDMNDDYITYNKTEYIPKSVVILINQATSAGALLATKILQKENATIVGDSQETVSSIKVIMPINEVYSFKMPVAKFYLPDGTVASGTTVKSDISLDINSLDDETLYEKIATIIKNR